MAAFVLPSATRAQSDRPEQTKVRLAVGGKVGLFYLPVTIVERLGYFKDEGLDVEMIDLASGAKALQALVGGSADVTSGSYEHTIQMQAKGMALTAFILQGRQVDYSLGIVKKKVPSYQSPKDLKGLKIAVSSPGAGTHMFLNAVLAQAGLKPEDVSVIGVGQSAGALAAMRNGEIDAIANTDPIMTILESSGEVRIVADARTSEGSRLIYGGDYPAGSLYTTTEYLRKNPRTVQALANAMVRALLWLQKATPQQVVDVLPQEFSSGEPEMLKKALEKLLSTYSADGSFPDGGGERVLAAVATYDPEVHAAKIDVSKTYDNRFAIEAARKVK
jgi:NitT/TauT family transport system substrate-binding protein